MDVVAATVRSCPTVVGKISPVGELVSPHGKNLTPVQRVSWSYFALRERAACLRVSGTTR